MFWNQDDFLDNRSDSEILETIEKNEFQFCSAYSLSRNGPECYDFEVLDSDVLYTNENKKVYFLKTAYTLNDCIDIPHGDLCWNHLDTYPVVRTVGLIFEGNGSWEIVSESNKHIFDQHYHEIIHMMKSFSFK